MIKSFIRTLSFFSKWVAEILREPALMLSLVLGPFLILLAFGAGTRIGAVPPPRTIVVLTEEQQQQNQPLDLGTEDVSQYLDIVGTTTNLQEALNSLAAGHAELVAVLPPAAEQAISSGERAKVQLYTNEIDPLRDSYTRVYLQYQTSTLNQRTVEKAIKQAQASSGQVHQLVVEARQSLDMVRTAREDAAQARQELQRLKETVEPLEQALNSSVAFSDSFSSVLLPGMQEWLQQMRDLARQVTELRQSVERLDAQLAGASARAPSPEEVATIEQQLDEIDRMAGVVQQIPAEVLSAPFELQLENIAPFEPQTIGFYAPAVLTLLLQHLAVTLGALSMARVRLLGLKELLQAAPVRPSEVVIGNYLSYATLCVLAAAVLVALLVGLLKVPIFGSETLFVSLVVLLILASLGIGFVVSMISTSEQQAAQIAMLILIASVFFSGFMIFLDAIDWPVRALAFLLPSTYAIRSLRDVMLKGVLINPIDLGVLAGMAVVFFIVTIVLFRRELRPR